MYDIPVNVQVMIILTKLPCYMDIIAQLLNMNPKEDEMINLSFQKIVNTTIMAWQQHVTKCKPQQQQANKVTTVKQKGQEPQFQHQRPQLQTGGLSGQKDEKQKSHWGKHSQAGEDN